MPLFGRRRRRRSRRWWRVLTPGLSVAGLLAGGGGYLGGLFDLRSLDDEPPGPTATVADPVGDNGEGVAASAKPTIRIATFNVQTFGQKKVADDVVMSRLVDIVRRFDVIAVQEIRGNELTPLRRLLDDLRTAGHSYAAVVSDPIGRDRYRERYAFVWNRRTVELLAGTDYVVDDPADRLIREPMVASFRCRIDSAEPVDVVERQPFSFTLINCHTSPDEVAASAAENEMDVLDDVMRSVVRYASMTTGEDDVILLGDLNVDDRSMRQLGGIPDVRTVVRGRPTNTRRTRTYDHLLIDGRRTTEYTGRWGVFDVSRALKLSEDEALAVSDHLPVWAEFAAEEAGPVRMAVRTRVMR